MLAMAVCSSFVGGIKNLKLQYPEGLYEELL
jgi:hypothetical protein